MISIDEDARKRFEADWLSGRSLTIHEYLPQRETETYIGTLEELVCIDLEFRWSQQKTSHSNVDLTVSLDEACVPTRVEDYLRDFPELSHPDILQRLVTQEIHVRISAGYVVEPSEYRSRFPTVPVDESLFSNVENPSVAPAQSSNSKGQIVSFPHPFGNYLLTGLLGRGGMGAVYRARQPSAGRDVAIKVADISSFNSTTRQLICQRFETEAHAAASLQHDHVVPIYDVGNVDEQPYYAMRLVEGKDLGALSKAEPLAPRSAARYMLGIARGIELAHRSGTLHRDIKPQNILVDGSTDRAMITDFGLARFMEDESELTQTGQVLGTPSFMPPEQIKDSSGIDARADVYSLGGTLYQLLTGRPPFKASNMHDTLRQVVTDEPVSPKRLNDAIDLDLDTICLKCLEKNPEERYQSAHLLAQDLELFLQGKPTLARPAGPLKRLAKWCRRNRSLSTTLGFAIAAVLLALGASVTAWILVSQESRRAASNFYLAADGVDELFVQISEEPLLKSPSVEPLRRRLLNQAMMYYEELESTNRDNPKLQRMVAFALAARGNMAIELKRDDKEAKQLLQEALAIISNLSTTERVSKQTLAAESNALVGLGILLRRENRLDEALASFRRASVVRTKWKTLFPEDIEAHRKLASSTMNEGLILKAQKKLADAETSMLHAQTMRHDLLNKEPKNLNVRRDLAMGDFNLAFLEAEFGNSTEALDRIQSSSSRFRELAAEVQTDQTLWKRKIKSLLWQAEFTRRLPTEDAAPAAIDILNEAISDLRPLLDLGSMQTDYSISLLDQYFQAIEILLSIEAGDGAHLSHVHEALDHIGAQLDGLDSNSPHDLLETNQQAEIQRMQLHLTHYRALLSLRVDDRPEVDQALQKAIQIFSHHRDLVNQNPRLQSDLEYLNSIWKQLDSLPPIPNN